MYDVDPYYQWGNTEQIKGKGAFYELAVAGANIAKYHLNEEAVSNYWDIMRILYSDSFNLDI